MAPFPVEEILPQLRASLEATPNLVLCAPPGAGKSTLVPPALLDASWCADKTILMLEPRRLAARALAERMAAMRAETPGQMIGYRMRGESRIGPTTRIEVITEGILTRRLQTDPALEGVGAVLFDEFHERNIQADLGLAFCLESQAALRPDLRLLAMSATLDAAPLARLMGEASIIHCDGRLFPVTTVHRPGSGRDQPQTGPVVNAIMAALSDGHRGILVFLPGEREIRAVEAALRDRALPDGLPVRPLYGALPPAAQWAALDPSPTGKVVLATDIAETSLTIEGVSAVVDAGLSRLPRFDPRSGMTRLTTQRASRAAADQRRGRAGRTGPGSCYRLWSEAEDRALLDHSPPEIAVADPAPLLLQARLWGVRELADLPLLDLPPPGAIHQATGLLRLLGALDDAGDLTTHGRAMAGLPVHPRLAHMLLRAREKGLAGLACALAALLSERDLLRRRTEGTQSDLGLRLAALATGRKGGGDIHEGARRRVRQAADQLCRLLGVPPWAGDAQDQAGPLLALAYPDRLARRRGEGSYHLVNGRGASLADHDPLRIHEFLAIAHLDGRAGDGRIFLAAPLAARDIETEFADQLIHEDRIAWERRDKAVQCQERLLLGRLVLRQRPLKDPDPAAVTVAMLAGIRDLGLGCLPWTEALCAWRQRVLFLRQWEVEDSARWPDFSDAGLLADLENWLAPWLGGIGRADQLHRLDLGAALKSRLDHRQQRQLDTLAPKQIPVPSGRLASLDYSDPGAPTLAVKLQELFGLTDTPHIAGGRVALRLHLLSPAGRPLQVTQDLAHFWIHVYPEVRKEMRGRYPKHPWPEDPLNAVPTARTNRRRQSPG